MDWEQIKQAYRSQGGKYWLVCAAFAVYILILIIGKDSEEVLKAVALVTFATLMLSMSVMK